MPSARVFLSCLLADACWALQVNLATSAPFAPAPIVSSEEEEQVARTLPGRCGAGCSEVWAEALSRASEMKVPLLTSLANLAIQKASNFSSEHHALGAFESALPSSADGLPSDVPCTTAADCKLKSAIANRCNYGREALQASYNSYNILAHTMAVAISELCGCTFTQGRVDCALENVPSVCIFPYNVYSKMFAGSVQLWEAVKAATKTCMIHGNSQISS